MWVYWELQVLLTDDLLFSVLLQMKRSDSRDQSQACNYCQTTRYNYFTWIDKHNLTLCCFWHNLYTVCPRSEYVMAHRLENTLAPDGSHVLCARILNVIPLSPSGD